MIKSILLAAMLTLTAACAAGPSAAAAPAPTVYVMRHLHTPEGVKDAELTAEGLRHAEALAGWFRSERPRVIYVSTTRRAQQTAAPLAARLKLTPRTYDPADTPGLVAAVLRERGPILIVGHSNTVPDIIAQLGGTRPPPLTHPDFADIWRIRGADRRTRHWKLRA